MVSFEGGDGWFHVSPSEGGIGNETTCVVRRWDVGSTPSFEHSVIPYPVVLGSRMTQRWLRRSDGDLGELG
jgi:hypothetical protein